MSCYGPSDTQIREPQRLKNVDYDVSGKKQLIEQPVVWKFGAGLITHPGIPT
jgi:hypothetical protein